ncbi:hypothetical protein [Paracandidimonas soli]|nr:hypothetical protein [Paracandidimonas soli]
MKISDSFARRSMESSARPETGTGPSKPAIQLMLAVGSSKV